MKRIISTVILFILNSAGTVYYTHAQISGNITYTLYCESNPTQDQSDAYIKITAAMDSATGYYNKYTTLSKHLNVYYNTGVQTADASFSGTIRFGASRSYMVAHTAMHEIAHTLGIGTTTEYQNLIKDNIFTGTHATAKLREITGDQSAVLHGDYQHFWPYGLNFASEVSGVNDLVIHCKIVNEIYQDLFHESYYGSFRLKSKSSGKIVYAQQTDLLLGNRLDSSSIVNIVALSDTNTFRLEFGDKVLDIPNETKDAGVQAQLWDWNGGTHQRAAFEFQSEGIVRIRMVHSGLYLREDSERILQDNATTSTESQYWELIQITDTPVNIADNHRHHQNALTGLTISNNRISFNSNETTTYPLILTILDLQGRIRYTKPIFHDNTFSLLNVSPGPYIARVQTGNRSVTMRDIIVK